MVMRLGLTSKAQPVLAFRVSRSVSEAISVRTRDLVSLFTSKTPYGEGELFVKKEKGESVW